nr:uncharacterized protein LOC117281138 [Nicotiana tomentosiformis]
MEKEAENFVARWDKCQRYANNMHRPTELLHSVISLWPFMKWGMDIVRPLPQAKEKVRFLLILTDYFSKRVEAVANGQAKLTNKVIINNLKTRLEESKGKWPKVLPEALIPVDISEPSTRYTHTTEATNEEELRVNLDLIEERGEAALIQMAAQKQMIERYYSRKANLRYFKNGDFVLKKIFWSTKAAIAGKLSPNWEGPYRVRGIAGKGTYELETMDGKVLLTH